MLRFSLSWCGSRAQMGVIHSHPTTGEGNRGGGMRRYYPTIWVRDQLEHVPAQTWVAEPWMPRLRMLCVYPGSLPQNFDPLFWLHMPSWWGSAFIFSALIFEQHHAAFRGTDCSGSWPRTTDRLQPRLLVQLLGCLDSTWNYISLHFHSFDIEMVLTASHSSVQIRLGISSSHFKLAGRTCAPPGSSSYLISLIGKPGWTEPIPVHAVF